MRHLVVCFATAVMLSTAATAAGAAVYSPQQQLPTSVVDVFKGAPSDLLKQYPDGGAQMISRVRDLAASDPTTLPMLVDLLKGTLTPSQQSAIVTGLAQVARLASRTDQAYYTEIQDAIAKAGNKEASDLYASLTGNIGTGAGAAGGGGGGAGGGGTGAGGPTSTSGFVFGGNNSGNATTFGARSYANQGTQTTTGSVGSLTNSAANIVSP